MGALALTALAACSGDSTANGNGNGTGTGSADSNVATSTTVHAEDGALVIGAILPNSGGAAEVGASMNDALAVALEEINSAGGISGQPVRLITREEGNNPVTAGLAVQDLVQLGVDAIIGPTSSTNVLGTLGAAVDAGVLTCSPTATALSLDEFPDNGLFFRTIPSDSLQARAIASVVETSGSSTAVVVYLDDDFGRPFAEATQASITAQGTRVAAAVGFTASDESISAAVDKVIARQPDVVAVIADGVTGPAIINAIDAATHSQISFVVNDAIRRPAASSQPFTAGLAKRVVGVAPIAYDNAKAFTELMRGIDPEATGLYAHNAYDCLNIIALAAEAAGSNQPLDIAAAIPGVTTSGTGCTMFTSCRESLIEGRNINYNGPTGNLSIGADGNVATANFERFTFDSSGRDITDGILAIGED